MLFDLILEYFLDLFPQGNKMGLYHSEYLLHNEEKTTSTKWKSSLMGADISNDTSDKS